MSFGNRKPSRVAVFISGGGSTLQALLEMQNLFSLSLVVSNRKHALGILKAKRFGVKSIYQSPQMTFEDLNSELVANRIERVFLAGYMKILPESFVNQWQGRIYNIHPSLLPEYPGLESAERNWADAKNMGVSIHQVTPVMDEGPVLLQSVSLEMNQSRKPRLSLPDSLLFLRRTEQHLLREFSLRYNL